MDFLKYVYRWSLAQCIYFWVLGLLLFFVGVFHSSINPYVSALFLSIFFGGGIPIVVGLFREYRRSRDNA
jgi:hypothetical protein